MESGEAENVGVEWEFQHYFSAFLFSATGKVANVTIYCAVL